MPMRPCNHPTCTAYLPAGVRYCPAHEHHGRAERAARDRHYDRHRRNPTAKAFYNSAAWQIARSQKLATHPTCERCERVFAEHVHHITPLDECTEAEKTDQRNLLSVCPPCHNAIEAEAAGA